MDNIPELVERLRNPTWGNTPHLFGEAADALESMQAQINLLTFEPVVEKLQARVKELEEANTKRLANTLRELPAVQEMEARVKELEQVLTESLVYVKDAHHDAEARFDNSDDDGAFYYDMKEHEEMAIKIEAMLPEPPE